MIQTRCKCFDPLADHPQDSCLPDVPLCALAMGCLCAWHAVGAPVEDECDANEERARQYAREDGE